jgi:hypothetical protein
MKTMRAWQLAALLMSAVPAAQAMEFAFASVEQGRAILGTRDEYVRATAPLERSARLHTVEPVDEERFLRHMQGTVIAWTDQDRQDLRPLLDRLERFASRLAWKPPAPVLLIKASDELEDGLPHTRANAIVVPGSFRRTSPQFLAHVVAHELFHILSRETPGAREQLYAAIGFRPCASLEIPDATARLRVTNPDAPLHRHTIAVRYQGQPVEALPYPQFTSESIDPRAGFKSQVRAGWLLVERKAGDCKVSASQAPVEAEQLEGLFEQVGRNTQYLWHPEEILAENFAVLFFARLRGNTAGVPTPDILNKMQQILY